MQCTVTDYILIFQCCVMLKILTAALTDIQLFDAVSTGKSLEELVLAFYGCVSAYKKEPIILASRFSINYLVVKISCLIGYIGIL